MARAGTAKRAACQALFCADGLPAWVLEIIIARFLLPVKKTNHSFYEKSSYILITIFAVPFSLVGVFG
jgi:hypothetical protein